MLIPSKTLKQGLYLLIIALFSTFTALASENNERIEYQDQLDRLYKSIEKVQTHLKSTRYRKSNVLTDLQNLEQEISNNALSLKKITKKINGLTKKKAELKNNITHLDSRLDTQRESLAEQMRVAYSLGNQQQLKLMLNQQDPAAMGQIQVYFDYLHKAQSEQIALYTDTLKEKNSAKVALTETLRQQQIALTEQKKRKKTLSKQRFKRSRLLAQIDMEINNQEQNLRSLESSRSRIETLLNSLGELLADIPPGPSDNEPFSSRKGRLPWPIEGKFIASFGKPRQGDLKWNGVLIGSPNGYAVRAISHGRIAFSDWLQGFGFLTIINHDAGFMSLYAHNESLFKQTGDWVAAGDVIASTGDSGGQPVSGLYFEIRARGKPVNPALWCSSKIRHN